MTDVVNPAEAFGAHNHGKCSDGVLAEVDRMVQETGLSLTPVRRRTLEILLEEHRAVGAYQVLDRLGRDGFGTQPPVAYRALDFLVAHGLAHRIEHLNAFAACMAPGQVHAPVFFICSSCEGVAEAPGRKVGQALGEAADKIGFQIRRTNVEIVGTCPECADGVKT